MLPSTPRRQHKESWQYCCDREAAEAGVPWISLRKDTPRLTPTRRAKYQPRGWLVRTLFDRATDVIPANIIVQWAVSGDSLRELGNVEEVL
jgi:hypothetical protein